MRICRRRFPNWHRRRASNQNSPNHNAPVPQHLAEHCLVELKQDARLGPPGDHEVATLGVRREERHAFFVFSLESSDDEKQLRRFLKASFFLFLFFLSLSLSRYSFSLFKERASQGGGLRRESSGRGSLFFTRICVPETSVHQDRKNRVAKGGELSRWEGREKPNLN